MRVSFSHPSWATRRKPFFIAVSSSFVLLQILFFVNLCYLYGSFFHVPLRTPALHVLMVNYDDGAISESLKAAYAQLAGPSMPSFFEHSSSEYPTPQKIREEVCKGHFWGAIYTQSNASQRLANALRGVDDTFPYDPTNATAVVWNEIRYPIIAEANIYASFQTIIETAKGIYFETNGNNTLAHVNSSSQSALQAMFNPISFTNINLKPTTQGTRDLYNTGSVIMWGLMEFFFVLAFNGICNGFGFFAQIRLRTGLCLRLSLALLYSFIGGLLSAGYIFIFKEGWDVNGAQFVLTWMAIWLSMHVNFLVLDAAAGIIPISFLPFFVFTWLITNIASTVMPFEVSAGFYRWGFALPAHNTWEMLIQIWSGGCYNHLYRTLPILFAWEIVMWPLDIFVQIRRCRLAALDSENSSPASSSNGSDFKTAESEKVEANVN